MSTVPTHSGSQDRASQDREEIVQLCYRYNLAIDSGDIKGWGQTWTEDGEFDVAGEIISGRAALEAWGSSWQETVHVIANPVVEVDGDTATLAAYIFAYKGTTLASVGTYQDQLVRTAKGWRFKKRVFRSKQRNVMETANALFSKNAG